MAADTPMAKPGRTIGLLAAITASLMLGACSQTIGDSDSGFLSALTPETAEQSAQAAAPTDPREAAEYWSKIYSKNPRDLKAALAYAQNLKTIGQKKEALAVLQQASLVHGTNRELAADYGRLALELDQISVAKKLLEVADDPAKPDWRIVLARGTVLAKEGSYREAITFYERARVLNPEHPSVLNNLALAYTMSGEADRGEQLLRQASATGSDNAKVRQNLALVLGLQGKYSEATKVGSVDLPSSDAQANTALLKQMVKLDPKSTPAPAPAVWPEPPAAATWATAVAESPKPSAKQNPAPVTRTVQAPQLGLRASTVETGSAASLRQTRAAGLFTAEE